MQEYTFHYLQEAWDTVHSSFVQNECPEPGHFHMTINLFLIVS